ncbi:MAG: hypothetical protein JXA99_08810 [Candidatus Lokiarchaeota archaeon]|nr:hypothetical protein [Candidatus Lokiarchaeota archaeon]
MTMKKHKKGRGFLKNVLITFENKQATIWKVYSKKLEKIITYSWNKNYEYLKKKELYYYFEKILTKLREIIQIGIKSVILINPIKKQYNKDFLNHIKIHQKWLIDEKNPDSIVIRSLKGSIKNTYEILKMIDSEQYSEEVKSAKIHEDGQIIEILQKRLHHKNDGCVFYTLDEIEKIIYAGGKKKKRFKPLKLNPEYIVITTNYIGNHPQKNRLNRLLQIVQNRNIKIQIINSENASGIYIDSLGGITCFLKVSSYFEKNLGDQIQRKTF